MAMSSNKPAISKLDWHNALLAPRSVALIGASDDETKTAARPLIYLRRAGFQGTIYPINPRRDTVRGEKAWPSLASLPEVPDHAFLLTPTEAVIDTVKECAEIGVLVVTILASGFSETGPAGVEREEQLREICRRTGIRVLGPSSLGVVNVHKRLILTANAAFAEPELPEGRIFVASHSGSLIGALVSRGKARGIGFAGLVSVGNEVDLNIGEICESTLDDPTISSYLLFLETIRHADHLRAFARGAAERGKPVIAYKLGRSSQAAELAVSHTGALAGEDDVADAFLKDCGIARVETFEALLDSPPLLKNLPLFPSRAKRPKVAVLTTTGGGAAMIVDQLGIRNVEVAAPSAETLARLTAADVSIPAGRILDLTLAGTRYPVMKATLDVLLSAPEFDLIVVVIGSSARFEPNRAVRAVIDSAGSGKPLAAFIVPDAPEALALLTEAGVPNFRSPEACADAIAAAFARRSLLPPSPDGSLNAAKHGEVHNRMLDELEAYELLDRIGIPHAPTVAIDLDAVRPQALPFPYPVVAKVLSSAIAHKTDVGGVVLGVANDDELAKAIATIRNNVAKHVPGTAVKQVLAQSMIKGIGEALIGYRVDPQVGPIVMLAAGGVLTEIYRDRSLRLAPVNPETAKDMIAEVKAMKALAGYRGKEAGDLDALANAIVALSQLALAKDVVVAEAEINPVIVRRAGEGVVAVDALVRLACPIRGAPVSQKK